MESDKVPMASASESEQQPILFEKVVMRRSPVPAAADSRTAESDSDNEDVEDIVEAVIEDMKADLAKSVNLDEAFDKLASAAKVESGLLETDIDAIVEKAAAIVSEKKADDAAPSVNIVQEQTTTVDEKKKEEEIKESTTTPKVCEASELTKEIIAQYSGEAAGSAKPPVPIQTYLWEDIKRAKEQGGYPWTHLYKNPLGENEEPEVILTYRRSPKSGRRSESDGGTPKAQKKVRIEPVGGENNENADPADGATEVKQNEDDDDDSDPLTELTDDVVKLDLPEKETKKTPRGILKKSQKIFGQMKPSTPKFDSDSLKKKIKTPIAKIKKMADDGISKVKSIKRTPSQSKSDKVQPQEQLEILKLKESPKSQHRDFASFIVKQDSDDTSLDIVDLEQSPSESRKNRPVGLVTPDEIINLPVSIPTATHAPPHTADSCRGENQITIGDKRREHHYEDIDDYISRIAFDSEHVGMSSLDSDSKLRRQDNISDPIFDEFSRDLNRKIRKSLSAQDDSIRHELMKRIPKIEELEKQISDEDREEKVEQPVSAEKSAHHLLAPISSIDSTSSDEDRRAQLSIVAEESETSDSNKKKSFDEPSVDIMDVESLQIDESDVSTLIDDEKRADVEASDEKDIEAAVAALEEATKLEEKEMENIQKEEVKEIKEIQEEKKEEDKKEEFKETNEIKDKKEAKEVAQESPSTTQEADAKEDVVIAQNLESPAPIKINPKWSKMSDHEYEPIGEPVATTAAADNEEVNADESEQQQKRKSSDTAQEQGSEKKLLRIPTDDSEDNISAQDFQDEIESRFFRREIEPISDHEAQAHQEKTSYEAVIIDEEPVVRELPAKKKSFMASASDSGKNLHKRIKAQASSIKSSINNKMKKKPKEKPVAVEVAQVEAEPQDAEEGETVAEHEPQVETPESITINMQESEEEASKLKKSSKMSKFTKNIMKPTMPKFKKPQFKRPDLKMGEKFSSLRKLGRSKSLKEESTETAGESTSLNTPEVASADPVVKKKFDFGTYPRMIRDKFKRPRIPERSDRSMVSDSPARDDDDFNRISQTFVQRGPVASRWPEYAEEESGKYQHFDSESELDREQENVRQMMTDEQRQLEDMDRENLQIHLMAKQEKFRKPHVERQESDDDKLMWSGVLNKNAEEEEEQHQRQQEEEEEFVPNALRYQETYKFTLDAYNNNAELNRSCTPATNQETQSSGSSGTRRRRGYLDEDDDEYFLREQQPLNSHHHMHSGDYIDSGIKEGLSEPDTNALTQMDHEYTPERPTRSLKRKKKGDKRGESTERPPAHDEDYFRTYPPNRPTRKEKKSISIEPEEDDIPFNEDDMLDDTSEIIDEEGLHATYKGIEHPDLAYLQDDFNDDFKTDYKVSNVPVPPTPPRRRKKKIRAAPGGFSTLRNEHLMHRSIPLKSEKIIVYHQEDIPLAHEEHFTTPTPTPRRTRSRSQISGYTLDDADSFKRDSIDEFNRIHESNKENNDLNHNYATIKKEMPSRPVRRKRSTKSLGDRQFATLPLMPRRSDLDDEIVPPRPPRNYSTIAPEKPDKPPRRKSASSLVEISKTMRDDDYEEILDSSTHDNRQRLKSGDVVNKMKDRPLPPPPRPTRAGKKQRKEEPEEDRHDRDDGAERIAEPLSIDVVDHAAVVEERPLSREAEIPFSDHEEHESKQLPRQDSEFSEPERPIEVEVSTQTDPVPDEEFTMEDDEDIDIEEFLASDGKLKTLEDILKEEQEAELERARQLQEAENLSRGIERFRESNQRSMSEKSRASTADRSRSLSRPITPSAVVVEMKKSSPIFFDREEQIMTEAGLFIHPITYDDYGIQGAEEEAPVERVHHQDEELRPPPPPPAAAEEEPIAEPTEVPAEVANLDVNNNLEAQENVLNASPAEEEVHEDEQPPLSPEPDINEIIRQAQSKYAEEGDDEEIDAEMQRKIEEMIESVMNSAREEAEWLQTSATDEEKIENVEVEIESIINSAEEQQKFTQQPSVEELVMDVQEIEAVEAPLPPPRRKSNIDESILKREPIAADESLQHVEEEIQAEIEQPQEDAQESTKEQQTDDSRLELSQQLSDDRPSSPFPSRIHLSSLEIDSLSVSALQAGRITASEIDSHSIVTNEFECKSSTPQPTTIEIPPGLIEEIVERVRSAERAERAEQEQHQQEQQQIQETHEQPPQVQQEVHAPTQETPKVVDSDPPVRPPLPAEYQQQTTQVPASFYQLRDESEAEAEDASMEKSSQQQQSPQLPQQQHHYRRKKHHTKKHDSTSEEEYQKDQRPRSRAGTSSGNDQSVAALGGQFLRACGNSLMESGSHLMAILRASSKDENNHDLHVAILILVIIVAGLFLMGMGEKSVHHHHWDFFNPPENPGR